MRLIARPLAAICILVVAALLLVNTSAGRAWLVGRLNAALPGVRIGALSGALPTHPRLASLRLADAGGEWLEIDDLALDWSAGALLAGRLEITALTASALRLHRLPASNGGGDSGGSLALPLPLRLDRLHIGRIDLDPAIAGESLRLSLDADARLDGAAAQARLHLHADPAALPGGLASSAELDASLHRAASGPARLDARLALPELAASLGLAGDITLAGFSPTGLALTGRLQLADLARTHPGLAGRLDADLRLDGPLDDLTLGADLSGEAHLAGAPSTGPLTARLEVRHLPNAPAARLAASGELAGAALGLDLGIARTADGSLDLAIDQASWRGATALGTLRLPAGALLPQGNLRLDVPRLAEFAPLLGTPLDGALTARLALPADATDAKLDATLTRLRLAGAELSARLASHGSLRDLALTLDAQGRDPTGQGFRLAAAASADATARRLTLARLAGSWAGLPLSLRGPARLDAAEGLAIDRLRLALGGASLDLAGRLSPRADASLALANLTPALLRPFFTMPDLLARARLDGTARLTGTQAHLDATARLGASHLGLAGDLGLAAPHPLALRATGGLDLADLNPLLAPRGAAARGRITLDLGLAGSAAAPRLDGRLSLAGGGFTDAPAGVTLSQIGIDIAAEAGRLRILQATARTPEDGRLELTGSAAPLAPGMPLDLHLTASAAALPHSDSATATLDADLSLTGEAARQLAAAGSLTLRRASYRIPERLPASVRPIRILRPGETAAPPPAAPAGPEVTLDLTLSAADRIFLRGRGVEAELSGRMHLGGTLAAPRADGGLTLRQGRVNLAGLSLAATSGNIRFAGGGLTDPDIDIIATGNSATTAATIELSGPASDPKLSLSSVPPLPSDEILSQLLFGQTTAQLSAFQLAQIAQTLASISGLDSGLSDPLAGLRQGLALDRLSVGGGAGAGAVLNAGRYVREGVYVGARQGLGGGRTTTATPATGSGVYGTDSQGVVEIDLTRRLKLEGTAGTGLGANSVGLTYQIDY